MRVIAGPEKKSRVMSEKERLVTAYHEMGHAIVGHVLPNSDPVHKVSIISRGQALGYTISLPTEDKFLTTRAELTDTMAMTLGGRAAEEIVFSEITTGASNDLEKVTETAKQMVMRFGMSERLGPRVFGHDRSMPFLGREFSSEPDYSDEIAREIDDEIRRVVEEAHQTAKDILTEHKRGARDGSRRSCSSARRSRPSSSSSCSTASPRTRSSRPTRKSPRRRPPRRRRRPPARAPARARSPGPDSPAVARPRCVATSLRSEYTDARPRRSPRRSRSTSSSKRTGSTSAPGPCISEHLPGLPDWVADIAHNPRRRVDAVPSTSAGASAPARLAISSSWTRTAA